MFIDDWIADPINKEEYNRLSKLWYRLPGAFVAEHLSTNEGWQLLQSSLRSKRSVASI